MFWLPGASLLGEDACPRCVSGPVWVGYALGVLLILLLWNSARLVGLLNRSLRQSIFGRTPDQEAGTVGARFGSDAPQPQWWLWRWSPAWRPASHHDREVPIALAADQRNRHSRPTRQTG
jgi:hypothetical protein